MSDTPKDRGGALTVSTGSLSAQDVAEIVGKVTTATSYSGGPIRWVSQKNNTAYGDLVAGNKYVFHAPSASPLAPLYAKLRAEQAGIPEIARISEQLQHFCTARTDGDVRGLRQKLEAAGRHDLLQYASELKELATKTLMKYQTSGVAQDIFTHILARLCTQFLFRVTPAVQAGKSRQEVDALIGEDVIASTVGMLGDNDLNLTEADIVGLVFFLGGNCHIRWDPC